MMLTQPLFQARRFIKTTLNTPESTIQDIRDAYDHYETLLADYPDIDILFLNYDPQTKKPKNLFISYTYNNTDSGLLTSGTLKQMTPDESIANYIQNSLKSIKTLLEKRSENSGFGTTLSSN